MAEWRGALAEGRAHQLSVVFSSPQMGSGVGQLVS